MRSKIKRSKRLATLLLTIAMLAMTFAMSVPAMASITDSTRPANYNNRLQELVNVGKHIINEIEKEMSISPRPILPEYGLLNELLRDLLDADGNIKWETLSEAEVDAKLDTLSAMIDKLKDETKPAPLMVFLTIPLGTAKIGYDPNLYQCTLISVTPEAGEGYIIGWKHEQEGAGNKVTASLTDSTNFEMTLGLDTTYVNDYRWPWYTIMPKAGLAHGEYETTLVITIWNEPDNLTVLQTITATFTFAVEVDEYEVTFADWDGFELKKENVRLGEAATAPNAPDNKAGWHFVGWDVSFSNVIANITVTALYEINVYNVTFVDWNGAVLDEQSIQHGGAAVSPDDPVRDGYMFIGWDADFGNIVGNLTVTALYEINKYTVTFVDWDGTVLKTETVEHFSFATAPADPLRLGWLFTGWDVEFDYITSELTVTALYVPIEITIFKPQTGSDNNVYINGVFIGVMKVETKTFTLADGQKIRITLNSRGNGNNTWIYDFTWL